ncbi:glycerol-3-phosphate dehydrogenase, mitochondrial-like [Clytia hemisphaerica]|uniref:glycerol-3-phosphate dehydrogenase, mitochondrial-like n=1 Tax=Clytia hemisphaerica TaxID=252671 RepID=UPI0034D41E16
MFRIAIGSTTACVGAYSLYKVQKVDKSLVAATQSQRDEYLKPLPSRNDLLKRLQSPDEEFDVLVIGGGATGCGVALDAQTRGLKTCLVEKYDYASGTSSRSTKLVHGGVRYLQKAIMNLDREQYHLVKEALHERANVLEVAPHIASPLPILLPVYKWWQVPYFWAGIKMYDLVAGRKLLKSSYYMTKDKTIEKFPMIKQEGLCGSIVYYDGQQDDARMNLTLAMSAIREGAACLNYVEVKHLLFKQKDGEKQVSGAHVRNTLTGEEWDIKAKCVINATGPFTDAIRKMDNQNTPEICLPASGIHITLPDYYCPKNYGLLDPATSDGRVIFFLPWEGKTIVGTTDRKCKVSYSPHPSEEEIDFVLKETKKYINPDLKIRRGDVLSAWSGIRPLVLDPKSKDTQSVSRNHVTDVSDSGLVTIAGGKWTTYRSMAQDVVDVAVKSSGMSDTKPCVTDGKLLEGADGWTPTYFIRLVQQFGITPEVAEHLAHSYGVKASQVVELSSMSGQRWPVLGQKLADGYPYIEAEVIYSARNEYACTLVDMLARRLRLAFLDVRVTDSILPRVADIMGEELGWDQTKRQKEINEAKEFLKTMGSSNPAEDVKTTDHTECTNQDLLTSIYKKLDSKGTGKLKEKDVQAIFQTYGSREINSNEANDILCNVSDDCALDMESFIKMMVSVQNGNIINNPLGILIQKNFIADHVTRDADQ